VNSHPTAKELETLRKISEFMKLAAGGSPTLQAIQLMTGLGSLNGAWKRVSSLESKGFLWRDETGIHITGRGRRALAAPGTFRRTVIEYLVRLEMSQYESLITEVNKRKFDDVKHRDGNAVGEGSGPGGNDARAAHD